MKISIVIPAFNEEKYIAASLKSLVKGAPKELLEILVVDNGSTDKTAEVAARYPKVRVLHEKKKGPSAARQCGLLAAKGDIVAFIDADTLISPKWYAVMLKAFRKHPKVLAVTGPLDFYDLPDPQRTMIRAWWAGVGIITFAFTQQLLYGCNFAARRKSLLSIGGFDTTIRFYSEDTDMGRRIKEIGQLKFLPDFIALTSGRRIEKQGLLQTSFIYSLNFVSQLFLHKVATEEHTDYR